MATAALPQDPDLDQLRNQARELQRAVRRGEQAALARVSRWHPDPPPVDRFPLTAAQLVLAREHGFPSWLYQAYARHDPQVGPAATVETARLLLDAGADPDDGRFWHALPTPFTVLTGVLGYGEHSQLWHPEAEPFARLLLERGADPNDGQTLYNRMFGSNDDHLVLLFEYGLGRDTGGPWHRLLGASLQAPAEMLRSLLAWAIAHDQRARVALLAEHGVDIVSPFTEQRGPRRGTPIEFALLNGHRELADQLLALGARPARLSAADAFVAAVLAGDTEAARQTPAEVIATVRRKRTGLVTWAAAQGTPHAVELLAAAGFDVNALGRSDILSNEPWHTALHVAAGNGNLTLARRLLELGADPDIPDRRYRSTPLGWARHFDQPALVELLEPGTPA